MLALIISFTGAICAMALFVFRLNLLRKQGFAGILKHRPEKFWGVIPDLAAFLGFAIIALSIYLEGTAQRGLMNKSDDMTLNADSLSALLEKVNAQHNYEKAGYVRREQELTNALKSKITNAYTLATPVIRTDTIVVIVRDTINEKKLKGRLEQIQLKNFELLKIVDSLRIQNLE